MKEMVESLQKVWPVTVNDAYVISLISLVFTVAASILGLAISVLTASAATLGYALENMVDTISSVLVLWRFWGGGKTVSEEVLATREKRASVAIALTFILLAVTVTSVAAAHLAEEQSPKDVEVLLALACPSVLVFGTLGALKLWAGATFNLDSPSLRKDGYCSVCGAIMSIGVLLGASLDLGGEPVWWLDSTIAIIIAAGLFAVGTKSALHNVRQGNKFWTAAFWSTPGVAKVEKRALNDGGAGDSDSSPLSETGNALVSDAIKAEDV